MNGIEQFLDCHNDVSELSKNLFNDMNLNYFNYAQFFNTGKSIFVSSNRKFTNELYNKKCGCSFDYLSSLVDSPKLLRHEDYYFFIDDCEQYDNRQLANSCGISDIILILERLDDSFLLFAYGSQGRNHATQTLLQYPDSLIKYKYQFMDQYQRKMTSLLPVMVEGRKKMKIIEATNMAYNPDKFKASMNPKHYHMHYNGHQVKVTAREKEALQHLACAKTAKEIAQAMDIQPITVTTYLKNLQEKLGVTTKRELLRFYYGSDLCVMDAEYFTPNRKK